MKLVRRLFPVPRWLAGYRLGYLDGVAAADREWALMLENDMVGPGLPHHPTRIS